MTCRIDRLVTGENLVVLRVSGRIHREHADILRELIHEEKGGVAIDLTEVMFADHESVKLFAVSEANGIELKNCPAYIREWVARERDGSTGAQLSDPKTVEGHDAEDI